ncbi:hypothetical protein C3L33_03074, partial [Rhododendron williamsianum]
MNFYHLLVRKGKLLIPIRKKPQKMALAPYQVTGSFQAFPIVSEPGLVRRPDSSSLLGKPVKGAATSSGLTTLYKQAACHMRLKVIITIIFSDMRSEVKPSATVAGVPRALQEHGHRENCIVQGNHGPRLRVLPDFVQVYSFIGSIFDPNVTGQLGKLKKMDPIDVETVCLSDLFDQSVLLLMRNLSINLTSPEFKEDVSALSTQVLLYPFTINYMI